MSLPRFLLRVLDPAGAEFRSRESHPPTAPVHHQAWVFGPEEPEGGRPPTDEELAGLEAAAAVHAADHDAAVEALLRRWSPQLEAAADRLLGGEPVSLRLGHRAVEARVLRFWRGDSLLEISRESATGSGRSLTRIPRDPRRLGREVFVHYLAESAA